MTRRTEYAIIALVVALCAYGLYRLTVRTPDPLDRAGPDAVYERERGR